MNPFDILMILVNGIGWGIKPITEKTAVSKIGHSNFTFIRYIVTAIIAVPFLCYNLKQEGISSLFKKNPHVHIYEYCWYILDRSVFTRVQSSGTGESNTTVCFPC